MPKLVCSPMGLAFRSMPTPAIQVTVLVPPEVPCWVADDMPIDDTAAQKVSLSGTQTQQDVYLGGHPLRELMRIWFVLEAPKSARFFLSPLAMELARLAGARAQLHYYPLVDYGERPANLLDMEPRRFVVEAPDDDASYAVFACGSAAVPDDVLEMVAKELGVDRVYEVFPGSLPIYSAEEYVRLLANATAVLGFVDQTMVLAHLMGAPTYMLIDERGVDAAVVRELDHARAIENALVDEFECELDCQKCQHEYCIILRDFDIMRALIQ